MAFGVAGVNGTPDLYYNLLATSSTLTAMFGPNANAVPAGIIAAATQFFANDPKYQAECKRFGADGTNHPNLIAPEALQPDTSLNSGSGGGG